MLNLELNNIDINYIKLLFRLVLMFKQKILDV